jgi:hypothetical protein
MNRSLVLVAAAVLWIAGCCKEHIVARAFLGHKTLDECVKLLENAEQPVSLACPGSEVTVCWGSTGVDKVKLTVSPDPDAQSGDYPKQGVLYLKPFDSTTVKLAGSCTSTTKQIQVINGPTPADFDASWDSKCTSLSYALDPNFVDPLILATDVTAQWEPLVVDGSGHTVSCPTPPFLNGTHTNPSSPIFSFSIQKPNMKQTFTHPQSGVTNWGYTLTACAGLGFKCSKQAVEPFEMTLVCPGQ